MWNSSISQKLEVYSDSVTIIIELKFKNRHRETPILVPTYTYTELLCTVYNPIYDCLFS